MENPEHNPAAPASPPAPPKPSNPLLSRIQMPGETFALPSGGVFYTNGELDDSVTNAEIRVHPMTAIDEITIKTPDMLFSGDAVRQIFERCIPQVRDVNGLLAKDVDFLLICLRKVSYGDEMQLEHKHDCEDAKTHTYAVDVGEFIRKAKKIDPTSVSRTFSVKMPNDQVVALKPISFKQFVNVMQLSNTEENLDAEELRDIMVDSLANIIISVDEVKDKEMIKEWLAQVRPQFLRRINDHIDKTLEWGPEFTTTVKCSDCGEEVEVVAPMNPLAFFT